MTVSESYGNTPRVITFNPEPEIFDERLTQYEVELWRRIEEVINDIWLNSQDIQESLTNIHLQVCHQEITIAATDLTTTEIANDTLITTGSPNPFRWNDPRLENARSIVLEPATGVTPMSFVWNRKADIEQAIKPVVDPATGAITWELRADAVNPVFEQPTYLQRLQWQSISGEWKLYAKAWEVGQVVHLTQILIGEATVLTP